MIKEENKLYRYILPTYGEITLFAMGLTCSLLLVAGGFSINWQESGWSSAVRDVKALVVIAFFLAGPLLSIHHALTDRPKTEFEKTLMLLFAVTLNAFSGIMGGSYFLESAEGCFAVFPVVNVASGVLLLMLLRARVINADSISDDNVTRGEVALTGILIFILF